MGASAGGFAIRSIVVLAVLLSSASCSRVGNIFRSSGDAAQASADREVRESLQSDTLGEKRESTLFDLFTNVDDPNTTIEVNKYLWNASLDVLNFLPIQSADPFTGVIVTGYGTPPGGGQAYRATIYIRDPALEARSLNVALATRGGPASTETVRAVEDAILTRARQLRIADLKL